VTTLDEILQRFVDKAPVSVMVRATLARVLDHSTLDDLFERHAQAQYTRELTFSTLVHLMTQVVFRTYPTVHAAYRQYGDIPVSVTALYDKLAGLETGISQALVGETAQAMNALIAALPARPADYGTPGLFPLLCQHGGAEPEDRTAGDLLHGLHLRTLDGNFLAGTEHRLSCLRDSGAAALPGMSLVVRDGRTGVLTDLIPYEDAYTNERAVSEAVMALVNPDDLWLADRNFCTDDYFRGIASRGAFFLIRHHAGTTLHPLGEEIPCGRHAGGTIAERWVRAGALECRCIVIRLDQPLRDGTTEIRLLTNVPAERLSAKRLAALYRTRWQIESAFQELTVNLRCELNTLGYPKAALFGFALAVVAYNVVMVIQAALASGLGEEIATTGLSSYHMATEVAAKSDGLAIAVPATTWEGLARLPMAEFARWLHTLAGTMDWRRYRKNPRGPKKPPTVKRTQRGAHRSTARELEEHRQRKTRQEPAP
jgi:hypothetical protein